MNLRLVINQFRLSVSSALLACGLISGAANADIDPHSLFLIANDAARNGSGETYILDLNFDILASDPSNFSGVTDPALADWLNDPSATTIDWGVYAVGNNQNTVFASQFLVVSTVNPADVEPVRFDQTRLNTAITSGRNVITGFNDAHIVDGLAAGPLDDGFPVGFGNKWADDAQFSSTGGLDDLLPMYIFGVDSIFEPVAPIALEGLWSLDASTGNVAFSVVPVPAAVWMFGSALVGIFGIRRRGAG